MPDDEEIVEFHVGTEFRLKTLEEAVESIGTAMDVFTEFMLSAKIWARVAAVISIAVFGIIQPVVIALVVHKLGA